MQAALQRPGMETPKHQFNTGVRTSLGDTAAPSPTDGLKPIADGIRRVLPFGLPKGEEQHDRTRRNTGGDARSQVDPPHGGTGARAQRQGRGRDQSPLRFRGYVDGPASLATIPPLAALREARLNGFPGALAGVLRHHVVGARRRVSDTSATGLSDAAKAGEPAYPLGPRFAGPRQGLARDSAPSIPQGRPRSAAACVFAQRRSGSDRCRSRAALAAPLAPNARAGRGPRSRPHYRLPPQPRRRPAPPGVDAGGEHDGGGPWGAHRRRVRGTPRPPAASAAARNAGGSKGGVHIRGLAYGPCGTPGRLWYAVKPLDLFMITGSSLMLCMC